LIEVLVVVAIIALLISILLPSLAAARDQAKRVQCGSNLHQIGVSLTHYVTANAGDLPVLYRTLSPFTTYYMRSGNAHGGAVNLGLLANRRYVNEPKAFYCPGQEATESASLCYNGLDNTWVSQAQYLGMSATEQKSVRVRSSYPARLITIPKANTQIGGTSDEEPMPASKLTGWKQEKYYQKVIYSDFTGVQNYTGGGIQEGFVSSPHGKKGFYRLLGDTSAHWVDVRPVERFRKLTDKAPTADEQVEYYKQLDAPGRVIVAKK
jgi:type II secretory pathway pseudopilin PulG